MLLKPTHIAGCILGVLLGTVPAAAQTTIRLAWDPNPEPDIAGYTVSWGTTQGVYTGSADVGNNTQWTFTSPNPDQRYYFVVQAYNDAGLYSSPSNAVSNDALITRSTGTLGDDKPGIFWRNNRTGQLMTWHLNGNAVVDTRAINMIPSDANWRVAGIGDMSGDGFSDILWRHTLTGQMAVWHLYNNQVIFTGRLSLNSADLAWHIGGLGDVDGDGFSDILWKHDDGRLAVWIMQGTTVLSTQYLSLSRMTNPFWRLAAVGDLNGDRMADIIWQGNDGSLATWMLQGTTVLSTQYLSIRQQPDVNWRILAAGRPDGTNRPAIVWRHATSGRVAFWYMNGVQVVSTVLTVPGVVDNLDWTIVGSR